ncbi:hypothetical protein [Nocardia sp. CA-120079]|uniref:hypothetical protein n=1 Tax=Nocardia sp. CA-120079 TaxID=3239974 RepID=UPI003D98EEC6
MTATGTTIHHLINCRAEEYEITIDPDRLDVDLVHRRLSTDAFWAIGRSRETVEQSMRASLNFGLYDRSRESLLILLSRRLQLGR